MSQNGDESHSALLAQHRREWQMKQHVVAAQVANLHKQFAEMPDVKYAPKPGEIREFEVGCPRCRYRTLENRLWNTINGIRHRFEAKCPSCGFVGTYDWSDHVWVGEDEFAAIRELLKDAP